MQPGDLIFFGSNGNASHIGIYIGMEKQLGMFYIRKIMLQHMAQQVVHWELGQVLLQVCYFLCLLVAYSMQCISVKGNMIAVHRWSLIHQC